MARTQFRTFSGLMVDPFRMTEGDIRLGDIARSQSLCNRYNGHTNFPYSVAQHEIILAAIVPQMLTDAGYIQTPYEWKMACAAAFMHDWSEVYVQDIITPIKHRLSFEDRDFTELEENIQKMIFAKYHIPWEFMELITPYDRAIYEDESLVLKPEHEVTSRPLGVLIEEWPDWRKTEQTFYQLFNDLELKHETKQ